MAGENIIRRLHAASPSEGPRFYLYLLLLHRRGVQSYEDIVTVVNDRGGSQAFFEKAWSVDASAWVDTDKSDYRRAAQAFGLIGTDDEYERALQDAAQHSIVPRLRLLFAHMLMHCEVNEPTAMLAKLEAPLSEGHSHEHQNNPDAVRHLALLSLQD